MRHWLSSQEHGKTKIADYAMTDETSEPCVVMTVCKKSFWVLPWAISREHIGNSAGKEKNF